MLVALYFFYAFLASGILNFTCSILILRCLAEAGIKVGFFEIRWQVHKHLKAYRQSSRQRTGHIAWPYYGYQASLAAMIGFGLLALISLDR
jgi:hypothetical protein